MNNLKHFLFILIPLAIIIVFWIVSTAMELINKRQAAIIYSEPIAQEQIDVVQNKNVFEKIPTTKNEGRVIKPKEGDILSGWQDSGKIRQKEYTQEVSTDIKEIIATAVPIVQPQETESTQGIAESLDDSSIWDWVPQTVLREGQQTIKKVPQSSIIRQYINDYGAEVKKVVKTLGNQPKIMSKFMSGRGESGNTTELILLAKKYEQLGKELLYITEDTKASEDIKKQGHELGLAYISVGNASARLAEQETTNDKKMIDEIYAYNAQIDHFAKEFVSFANLIGAYGITFKQGEGGALFTPPVSGGVIR